MAEFIVTTLIDEDDGGDLADASGGLGLSLREAIRLANTDSSASYDNIIFQQGISGLIRLTRGEIEITDGVKIIGGNLITITGDAQGDDETIAGITNVDASLAGDDKLDDNSRIFYATAGLILDGLTLTGGRTTAASEKGGAVYSSQSVTLNNSTISGNSTAGSLANGGGLSADLTIEVTNSTISGNSTNGDLAVGGGVFANQTIEVTNSAISGNSTNGDLAVGGGVFASADITVANSTISDNSTNGDLALGGGVFANQSVEVANSTIRGNSTDGYASRGGGLFANQSVGITSSTISGNSTAGEFADGGGVVGVADVRVTNSIVLGNEALLGNEDEIIEGLFPGDGVITVFGENIIGSNADAFDTSNIGGDGSVVNAAAVDVFADAGDNNDSGAMISVAENQTVAGVIMAGDDNAGVSYAISGGADAGLFTINAITGVLSFLTAPDFEAPSDTGADNVFNVEVTVSDSDDLAVIQALAVTVTNVNEAPVAIVSTVNGDEDTVFSGVLTASDVDGDTLVFALVDGPSNGTVEINDNGSFQFTPVANFNGTDSFTFRASDSELSDVGTTAITVNPVDDPVDPVDPMSSNSPTQGDDRLLGTALNETINALAGNDTVFGLAGDDLLIGRSGDDSLRGNRGDDTVKGGGGDDNLKGNGGEDLIRGNGGADVIRAGSGDDNVKGGSGDDLIFGGGGADQLNGGSGADTLRGNGGDDTLKGNGGADVFQFRFSDRNDTIADFRQGQDKIEIQNGAGTFEALSIEQDGGDVLIGFGAGQVRVMTDNVEAFDESDFIF